MTDAPDLAALFLTDSRAHLVKYRTKIERALTDLTDEDVWWRPNAASNSIGNLMLHLSGNARQWIVHGVGGEADVRERSAEFGADEGPGPSALLQTFIAALDDVDAVLAELRPEQLHEPRTIQGLETTVLGAVYHVVEHLATHTGQILYIAKLRTGRDLGFYQEAPDGRIRETWREG